MPPRRRRCGVERLLELRSEQRPLEHRRGAQEFVSLERPAARVLVGQHREGRALDEPAIESRVGLLCARPLAALDLEQHQRRRAPRPEQPAGRLGVNEVVERLPAQVGRFAKPGRIARQLLEELRHSLGSAAVSELREFPARCLGQRSAHRARALVEHGALLLESAGGAQRESHVARRIDPEGERPRALRGGGLRIDEQLALRDPQCGQGRLHARPGLARGKLRVARRRSHQARQIGASEPLRRDAQVLLRTDRHRAGSHRLGRGQRALGEVRQCSRRKSMQLGGKLRPAAQAQRRERLLLRKIALQQKLRQRLRGLRFGQGDGGALARGRLLAEQLVQLALPVQRPILPGQGEFQACARAIERLGLRGHFVCERQGAQLCVEQKQRGHIGRTPRRLPGLRDLIERLALHQPRMIEERRCRHHSCARGPALPEQISLGAQERMRLCRELARGDDRIGRQRLF